MVSRKIHRNLPQEILPDDAMPAQESNSFGKASDWVNTVRNYVILIYLYLKSM